MIYLKRQGFGEIHTLQFNEDETVIIGRNPASGIQFGSSYVSRRHCEIRRIPPHGTLLMKNCTDNNVTYVDGIKLSNMDAIAELRIGSLVGLGVPLNLACAPYLNDRRFVYLKVCQEEEDVHQRHIPFSRRNQNQNNENQIAAGSGGDLAAAAGSGGDLAAAAGSGGDLAAAAGSGGDLAAAAGSGGDLAAAAGSGGDLAAAAGSGGDLAAAAGSGGDLAAAAGSGGDLAAAAGSGGDLAAAAGSGGDLAAAAGSGGDLAAANMNAVSIKTNLLSSNSNDDVEIVDICDTKEEVSSPKNKISEEMKQEFSLFPDLSDEASSSKLNEQACTSGLNECKLGREEITKVQATCSSFVEKEIGERTPQRIKSEDDTNKPEFTPVNGIKSKILNQNGIKNGYLDPRKNKVLKNSLNQNIYSRECPGSLSGSTLSSKAKEYEIHLDPNRLEVELEKEVKFESLTGINLYYPGEVSSIKKESGAEITHDQNMRMMSPSLDTNFSKNNSTKVPILINKSNEEQINYNLIVLSDGDSSEEDVSDAQKVSSIKQSTTAGALKTKCEMGDDPQFAKRLQKNYDYVNPPSEGFSESSSKKVITTDSSLVKREKGCNSERTLNGASNDLMNINNICIKDEFHGKDVISQESYLNAVKAKYMLKKCKVELQKISGTFLKSSQNLLSEKEQVNANTHTKKGREEETQSSSSEDTSFKKHKSNRKRNFKKLKKARKRPVDSESENESCKSMSKLPKKSEIHTLIKKNEISHSENEENSVENDVEEEKTLTYRPTTDSPHQKSFATSDEPPIHLKQVIEPVISDLKKNLDKPKIKAEPNLESGSSRLSSKNLFGNENGDSDGDDDDDDVCYSQIDEVVLLSSDEETSFHEEPSDSSLVNLSFGPLPPSEVEFEISSKTTAEEYDLPDLTVGIELNDGNKKINELMERERVSRNEVDGKINKKENEMEKDDDDWWPVLSQEFFDDDDGTQLRENTDKEKKIEKKIILYSSPMKDLEKSITERGSRQIRKSQLTEFQPPPSRTKQDTIRKRRGRKKKVQDDKIPSTSHPILKLGLKSLVTEDQNEGKQDHESGNELQAAAAAAAAAAHNCEAEWLSRPSTSSIKNPKSSNTIRKTLLKTHNLEMYKRKTEKKKHHLVKSSHKSESAGINKEKQTENISIQHNKSKGSTSVQVKKGIAKMSRVSRSQKLTEFDLFAPVNQTKPNPLSNFKIPKKPRQATSDSKETESVNGDKAFSVGTEKVASRNVCESVLAEMNKVTINKETACDKSVLKSILSLVPKSATKIRYNVRFPPKEDDLVAVKLISPRKERDCFGPKKVQLKEIYIKERQQTDVIIYPCEFIHKLCNWNYDWLETYRVKKKDKKPDPPEICDDKILPTLTLYDSFDDYKRTFSCLMYYELWENIFRDWDHYRETNAWFACEIDANKITFLNSLKFSKVKAICLITNEWSMHEKHPATGSLVVMKYKMDSKTGHAFGYTENVTKRRAQCVPQHLKQFSQKGADTVVTFEILLSKHHIEQEVRTGKLVHISNVSYIRPSLRAFESLCNLHLSPLSRFILNPGDLSVLRNENNQGDYLIHQLPLNEVQKNAILDVSSKCIHELETPKISLIHGPPGTGKTRVITALIAQINLLFKESEFASNRRILLCAPSNAAVDELVMRLAQLKKVGINLNIVRVGVNQSMHTKVKQFSLDAIVSREFQKKLIPNNKTIQLELEKKKIYSEQAVEDFEKAKRENQSEAEIQSRKHRMHELLRSRKEFEESCKLQLSSAERIRVHNQCKKMVLMKAEVIATTLTSCLSGSLHEVFGNETSPFSCCIVDEAGQGKETETWLPLQLGIKKLVLVGDHLQLPATVLSQFSQGKKLHQSLFERLYHHIGVERRRMDIIHSLNIQYRMHEAILAWPSAHFYHNMLTTAPVINEERSHALQPYLLFDVKNSYEERKKAGEIFNITEVLVIRSLIESQEKYLHRYSIGILTPYQQQKICLSEKLDHLFKKLDITVSTVDNFQGQEKDVIFCSFVRANSLARLGFVSDRQRLNVALTRARKSCFIVGDVSSLQSNADWRSLIEDARRRKLIREISPKLIHNKNALLRMTLA